VHDQPSGKKPVAHDVLKNVLFGHAVMQKARAISSAAFVHVAPGENSALGFPVVPLEVWSRATSSREMASNPFG